MKRDLGLWKENQGPKPTGVIVDRPGVGAFVCSDVVHVFLTESLACACGKATRIA